MIPYIIFALLFVVGLDALRQCIGFRMEKNRLIITPNSEPLVIAWLIKMDETEAGISFELVRRGGEK